ncbi:mechanosensitive ion channel family protein [Oceanicella actignis]|uniref:Small-conductance mechanosensitive channel n=1 Tax=Oceanicella actignis TaxID=1189325 RepID=A0A1M7TNC2_9RHOB|nr:mechanosensitive ion channel family protein [Oceanicella actignis]SET72524.1 Small-conductance mechanosensitive channel [Oceanicella actignis]SHN72251.1 Small-conductance mechanosensitive channel [Oceanicella actignis]
MSAQGPAGKPRLLLALALALAAAALWGAQAGAQILSYEKLFPSAARSAAEAQPAPASEPLMSRPAAEPDAAKRAPDLAAYGTLADYGAESVISRTTETVSVFRQRLERMLARAPTALEDIERALARAAPDGKPGYFAGVALVAILLLMIGRAVVVVLAVYVFRPLMIAAQRGRRPEALSDKLPVLALRMAITLAAIAINLVVAVGLGFALMRDHPPTATTGAVILGAYALFMLVDTGWRMTVSPYLSDYRIPAISDADARRLYLWLSAATFVGIAGQAFCAWLLEMDVPTDLHALVTIAMNLVATALIVVMIWTNRRAVSNAILGGRRRSEVSWLASFASLTWAPLATVYVLAAWAEESFRTIMGLRQEVPLVGGALLALMLSLICYALIVYAVERAFARARARDAINADAARRDAEEASAAPAHASGDETAEGDGWDGGGDGGGDGGDEEGGGPSPARAQATAPRRALPLQNHPLRSFEDLARRAASLFALGLGAYVVIRFWGGPDIFDRNARLDALGDTLDTLFFGYIAFHAARIWLDRKIAEEGADDVPVTPGDEGGASSASRLATLLPLFRSAILVVIGIAVALTAASELGFNVAPIFAGAGIVGLAIGFGAQTLVRDILSGVFFLIDDAFRKGEYIDVGDVKGTVEKISVRSMQLRHHLGALHTIPFGEIRHLTNYSRDWVMMKLPLRLTYDTDVERVRKLIKKLGQELLQHPTEGRKFLQPLKSQGVYKMEDSAMIIRVKYMTRPGDQWTTRKLVYQKIRELFEKEGIRFAAREVTVRLPDLPAGAADEERARIAGAAARRVADLVDEEAAAAGGGATTR